MGRMRYFFFQAEDGIRDIGVTGVQTCALPDLICSDVFPKPFLPWIRKTSPRLASGKSSSIVPWYGRKLVRASFVSLIDHLRSEERRVGKECRSRWSPYH